MRKEYEKDIQRAIIDYLRLKKYVIFKHNSTQYGFREGKSFAFSSGDKGISDLIGCSPAGKFIAIEVKRKGGKITSEQHAFIRNVILNGGQAFVAHSLDDVVSALKESSKGTRSLS